MLSFIFWYFFRRTLPLHVRITAWYLKDTIKRPMTHWNNRRSRRVFLCFDSAIFKLTSAKFQTFAYTVTQEQLSLASPNFDKKLKLINYMFLPNFEAIGLATLVLEPENFPESLT